ncbi:MAG: tetratricopeptide repeat protein [Verrucomicrobiae bacterium]|nr:tetratricopeptide repeat protein [Verrucomicrobiae bacterium]
MRIRSTNCLAWSFLRRTDSTPSPLPERRSVTGISRVGDDKPIADRRSGQPVLRARQGFSISVFVRYILLSGLLLLKVPGSLLAVAPDATTTFDAANRLYEQGHFKEAAVAYEQMLAAGQTSPAVYFNLGNALFKSGQIGRAIALYRELEQRTPRDPDLRANLQFARHQVQGPTLRARFWERALAQLSLDEWTRFSAVLLWLTFALLTVQQLRPNWKRPLRSWTLLAGVALLLLLACLTLAWRGQTQNEIAIVVANEASLRASPFEESQSVFIANDGAELRVLDQKDDWLQVTDGNRRIGWIKGDAVIIFPRSG